MGDDSIDMEDDSIDMGYLVTLASSGRPGLAVLDVHEGGGHERRLRRRGQVERLGVVVHIVGVGVHDVEQAAAQGLTFVHLSAQRRRFLWDKGCLGGV